MDKKKIGNKILITGGAGFIGSNLVSKLIKDERVSLIRVIDDLSTGDYQNLKSFEGNPKFEFVKGDICDFELCLKVVNGIDKISHQAALGSVPRSIINPSRTTEVNILGTVNILHAAVLNNIDRIVLACSSSTYGDHSGLPKTENFIGNPLSPYAVTKLCIEQMAFTFNLTYGLNYIGLRYFNIFGPNQSPNNPYAAVVPIFCNSYINDIQPVINGDGETSRDFTYIDNAVLANELALFTENSSALNQIYNTACNDRITLNQIVEKLKIISGKNIQPIYNPERKGDIRHSMADISKIKNLLNYSPLVYFDEGLNLVYNWYKRNLN
jgi:UDP-N-acetylglucosamine 4-epimerase